MLDPSATAAPTLPSPVTALAAIPAAARAEGGAAVDFSAVLAGLKLGANLSEAPEAPSPSPADLTMIQAANTGKLAIAGNRPGKILPPGKPAADAEPVDDHRDLDLELAEAEQQDATPAKAIPFAIHDQLAPQERSTPVADAVGSTLAEPLPQALAAPQTQEKALVMRAEPRPSRERQALNASTALPLVATAPLPHSAAAVVPLAAKSALIDAPSKPTLRSNTAPVRTPADQSAPVATASLLQPVPAEPELAPALTPARVAPFVQATPDLATPQPAAFRVETAAPLPIVQDVAAHAGKAQSATAAPVVAQAGMDLPLATESLAGSPEPQPTAPAVAVPKPEATNKPRLTPSGNTIAKAADPAGAVPTAAAVTPAATIAIAQTPVAVRAVVSTPEAAKPITATVSTTRTAAMVAEAPAIVAGTSDTALAVIPAPNAQPPVVKVEPGTSVTPAPTAIEATVAQGATVAPESAPRSERPQTVLRAKGETLHASFTARTIAPVDLAAPTLQPTAVDPLVSPTAMPFTDTRPTLAFTAAPAPAGQDLAALVDRIVEARAAAAPDTVRAALVHQEFGSVSLRLHTEDAHIQVTLGSADPTFAPAVHAAAAATLAGNAQDGERRDQASQHQLQHQSSHEAGASNAQTSQQHQSPRNAASTSERVPSRDSGQSRSAPDQARQSQTASDRRGGIYA